MFLFMANNGRLDCGTIQPAMVFQLEPYNLESTMSIKGHIKEAAGAVKEELNEHGKTPESQRKAAEGRELRNEGRVEDGKAPKTTQPGTGH